MNDSLIFQQNQLLKECTTFGIGGPAKHYLQVRSTEEMQHVLRHCLKENIPYFILGKGSNSLFDDKGFDGLVIHNKIDFMNTNHNCFHVGAGYSFSLLGSQTARQGWAGLEFASGIPGSVGGAVWMNAGANGSETCQTLKSVDFVTDRGELIVLKREDLTFSYRSSPFQKMAGAITGAIFALEPSQQARQKQLEIIDYRKKTQPLTEKSAGCIFRNPECGHAGALIERSQLKGARVGGAQVSQIHANFIINTGLGTSQDVLKLIQIIQARVKEETGISLESEVRYIPYTKEFS